MTELAALKTALNNTPLWVYILFAYLLWVGFKNTKTRTVSIKKILIIPAVFLSMSLESLISHFRLSMVSVSIWCIAILIGTMIGRLLVATRHIQVDRTRQQIKLKGDWIMLLVMLMIFFSKYYFGYQLGMDPKLATNTHFELVMLMTSGLCSGIMVGRSLCYFMCYRTKPTQSLEG